MFENKPRIRTLGLVGGVSWESTNIYYQLLNEGVQKRLGGNNAAELMIHSFNFQRIVSMQERGDWAMIGSEVYNAARHLQNAGAEALILCSNSIHKVAPQVESRLSIPLLNIVDIAGAHASRNGWKRVGLLGTRFTMGGGFYQQRLADVHGIEVLLPEPHEQEILHRVIIHELCRGQVRDASEAELLHLIDHLVDRGVGAILLGCTELAMLMREQGHHIPMIDATGLHVDYAIDWMLRP